MLKDKEEEIKALMDLPIQTASSIDKLTDLISDDFELKALQQYVTKVFALAEGINYTIGMARSMFSLGKCYERSAAYDLSIQKLLEALELFKKTDTTREQPFVLDSISASYYQLGEFEVSLKYCLQALAQRKEQGATNEMGVSLMNIGNIYSRSEDYKNSLIYYDQALVIFNATGTSRQQASLLGNIGGVYANMGKVEKALEFFGRSLKTREELKEDRNKGSLMNNIGQCHLLLKDFVQAKKYFYESIRLHNEHDNRQGEASALLNMGELALAESKSEVAIECLLRALVIARELKIKYHAYHIHKMLCQAYMASGNYKTALEHHMEFHTIREEVHNQDSNRKIQNIQHLHQLESAQKEAEIERLKTVELKKAYLEIEEKKKELDSSINYAQRIQEAILPSRDSIRKAFSKTFGLYKSKDVISGDFFWFAELNGRKMIAAADCTGHGVPGALMSMIGLEKLNYAVREKQLTSPSEILSVVNTSLKTSLKQNEQSAHRDGMDIALCSFNFETNIVEFSGANRPLYYVRKGELVEVGPTKSAIGGHTPNEQVFVHNQISFQQGDTFYLFSDGIVDQFGGTQGKKFMSRRWKELLIFIQHLEMEEQRTVIWNTFQEWKDHLDDNGKTYEQTDDVSVIGIRI